MRFVVSILLAIVLVPAGIPHGWCACGCSPLGRRASEEAAATPAAGCPHCCGDPSPSDSDDSRPGAPEPCKCGACYEKPALISPTVSGHANGAGPQQKLVDLPVCLPSVIAAPSVSRDSVPGSFALALPVRALPILLGHLLL